MKKSREESFHYSACGLDNVYLVNLPKDIDRAGHQTITIPNVNDLHQLLQFEVATKEGTLNQKEVRFLRVELGLTQAQLARLVHKDGQTVGRWERGETQIDGTSETLFRAFALEQLFAGGEAGLTRPSIQDLTELVNHELSGDPYRIEASDPDAYRRAA